MAPLSSQLNMICSSASIRKSLCGNFKAAYNKNVDSKSLNFFAKNSNSTAKAVGAAYINFALQFFVVN